MSIHLTPIQPDDFPAWKLLRKLLYSDLSDPFHDQEMQWLCDSPEAACFLVCDESGQAIGLLELSLRNFVDGCIGGPVGYIEGMYLLPEHRGQGRGRELIALAAEWFRAQGYRDMATDAEIDNTAAREFYRKCGFIQRWEIVGFTKGLVEGAE